VARLRRWRDWLRERDAKQKYLAVSRAAGRRFTPGADRLAPIGPIHPIDRGGGALFSYRIPF
jgi:hypothetical protein